MSGYGLYKEQFLALEKKDPQSQGEAFLRAFCNNLEGRFDEVLALAASFTAQLKVNTERCIGKKDVYQLEHDLAHQFFRSHGEPVTDPELREIFKKVDLDSSNTMSFIEFLLWKYDQPLPGLFAKAPVEDLHLLDELTSTFAKARLLNASQSEHEDQIKALEQKVEGGGFQAAKAGIELKMLRAKRMTVFNQESITTNARAKVMEKVTSEITTKHAEQQGSAWAKEQARIQAVEDDKARLAQESKNRLQDRIKNMGFEPATSTI